ncbi:ADP-ribosylglycohydrolase [Bittarella massiliensis (ex Durand et al. 2017)]|uniref:ADP-ribosylglycohydrolase n=2 Tax=Eubacteriales TaxID=186802 RepID=A0AAQ1MEK0_9FIRM|nr:ADP-ribosylglycohydrolase family protein [Bittarella massiliensis (ex Durand et al. 2017)]SHG33380.1 ADP-ribosylglycohydrolase [Bittarella massiliensis (ex Durand et al. 2017)]
MQREDKLLGCLAGAAIGDSMGGPAEERSTEMILEDFGGYVTDFRDAPLDTWAYGAKAGMVTDDFSLAYFTLEAAVEAGGQVTRAVAEQALLKWAQYPAYFDYNVGPTTKAAVRALRGEPAPPRDIPVQVVCENGRASNGAAMKIGPVALLSGGDVDRAIADAVEACLPTHPYDIPLAGACAVAAAVAKAMQPGAALDDLRDAGLYGAREGMRLGALRGRRLAGPSVERRIALAWEIGRRHAGDWRAGMAEIRDLIGNGLATVEAVPAAFGLLAAAQGRVMETVYGGVNIGGDTDTIATIAGAMAGAFAGAGEIPPAHIDLIERQNQFDLRGLAQKVARCLAGER